MYIYIYYNSEEGREQLDRKKIKSILVEVLMVYRIIII